MNSTGDLSLRKLYLNRLVGALNALKKPTTSNPGNEEQIAASARNIKLAADVSLALTVTRAAWSRALLNRISGEKKNRVALRKIVGLKKFRALIARRARCHSRLKRAHLHQHMSSNEFRKKQSISLYRLLYSKRTDSATSSNARQVKKRTKQLQSLVPGGKSMDTSCLLRETADYIASLTTQVDVLQFLVISANNRQPPV